MAQSVHTWATLRAPIGLGGNFHTGNSVNCNVNYGQPPFVLRTFVATTGLNMMRTYINPLQPTIGVYAYPLFFIGFNIFAEGESKLSGERTLTDDQVDELIGENVDYSYLGLPSSFVMTADAWTSSGQTTTSPGGSVITAIGKLTIV